jgi:hypothetical protein
LAPAARKADLAIAFLPATRINTMYTGSAIKTLTALLLFLLLSGPLPASAQLGPSCPPDGPETVRETPASSPAKAAPKKPSAGSSPKQQIKEGGREIGRGFKELGLGIGRGFKNMGQAIKKAWTGGKEE